MGIAHAGEAEKCRELAFPNRVARERSVDIASINFNKENSVSRKAAQEFTRRAEEASQNGDHLLASRLHTRAAREHGKTADKALKWAIVAMGGSIFAQIVGVIAKLLS